MRKIAIFTILFMLVSASALAAEPIITSKNAAENIISISGAAPAGSEVSILVLNPGYTESDAVDKAAQAQQYVRSATAGVDGYSFDIKILAPSDGGGTFTVIVNAGGEKQKTTFNFYPIEAKLNTVDNLNKAASTADILAEIDRIMEVYGLDGFPLYTSAEKTAEAVYHAKGNGFSNDADAMYKILRECCLVASYNGGAVPVDQNGMIVYADVMGIAESEELKDYTENLNAGGKEKVYAGLKSGGYKTIGEVRERFEQLVALACIVNYKSYGSGHVKEYLEKYSEVYQKAGCDYSKLDGITGKSDFYAALVGSNAGTLAALAGTFNSYKANPGGSSGTGGPSVNNKVPQVSAPAGNTPGYIPQEEDNPEPSSGDKFNDIAEIAWAKDAIETLAEMGAINGKGEGKFDPYAPVTRAEFVKILVSAMSLANPGAVCTFDDVTEEWSKPYIASAAALGIVTGTGENQFSPNAPITREQGAAMLYRAAGKCGIILDKSEGEPFADDGEISGYAKEGVYALLASNIISGKGSGIFAPKDYLQRAEAAKIIYGILQAKE